MTKKANTETLKNIKGGKATNELVQDPSRKRRTTNSKERLKKRR